MLLFSFTYMTLRGGKDAIPFSKLQSFNMGYVARSFPHDGNAKTYLSSILDGRYPIPSTAILPASVGRSVTTLSMLALNLPSIK